MRPGLRLLDDTEQKLESDPGSDLRTAGQIADGGARCDHADPIGCAEPATGGVVMARPGVASASDTSLMQLALSALAQSELVPAGKVQTVVRNGWLILEGQVEARIQRQAAGDAIKALPGIRGVSNNILIESEVMAQRVSRKINEAFVRSARLSASQISVTASNHKIILCGSVHSGSEREQAEAAAWAVPGVGHVVNRIRASGGDG